MVVPTIEQFIPVSAIREGWLKSKKQEYPVEKGFGDVVLIQTGEQARVVYIKRANAAMHAEICNIYTTGSNLHIRLKRPAPFATLASAAAAPSRRGGGGGGGTVAAADHAGPGFVPYIVTNRMVVLAEDDFESVTPIPVPADCLRMRMPDPEPLKQDEAQSTIVATEFYTAAAAVLAQSDVVELVRSAAAPPAWKAVADVNRREQYKAVPIVDMISAASAMHDHSDEESEDGEMNGNGGSGTAPEDAAAAAKAKKPLIKPQFKKKRLPPGSSGPASSAKKQKLKTPAAAVSKTPPKSAAPLLPYAATTPSAAFPAIGSNGPVAPAAKPKPAQKKVPLFGGKASKSSIGSAGGAAAGGAPPPSAAASGAPSSSSSSAAAATAAKPKKKRAPAKKKSPEEIQALVAKVDALIAKGTVAGTVLALKSWLAAKATHIKVTGKMKNAELVALITGVSSANGGVA